MSPGPIDTEFAQASNLFVDKKYEKIYGNLPKLLAEDVADSVTYILSTPPHVQVCLISYFLEKRNI